MAENSAKSSDLKDIPAIPPALITALEARFPNRCPQINDSERLIWMNAGKAELIQWLRDTHNRRCQEGLTKLEVIQRV